MKAPAGTVLRLGDGARVQITEERTPCVELEDIAEGLLHASLGRCGRFAAVIVGGHVRPGDAIALTQASPATASSAS